MPDLLSETWSDSDSSQDARDVEMQVVPDDLDGNLVDDDEGMTALVNQAQAIDRRTRVEEEVEPQSSQSIPTPNSAPPLGERGPQPSQTLPPWNFGPSTIHHSLGTPTDSYPQPTQLPPPDRNADPENARQDARGPRFRHHTIIMAGRRISVPPEAFTISFGQLPPTNLQPQTQTPQQGQRPDQPDENLDQTGQPGDTGRVAGFFDMIFGEIQTLPPHFTTAGPGPQPPSDGPRDGNGSEPEPPRLQTITDLFRLMFEGEPPEEKDNPERAVTLVKGLECVPDGLVKRMTRVDSAPGAHEDSMGSDGGEAPGCAICWDSLLPEESSDAELQFDPTAFVRSVHQTEGSDSESAVSDHTPDDHTPNIIICLPCSHVFHASCLIPWFSKPKHTTCPTCRFDIDPKGLTYTPPQREPRSTPAQPVPNPTTAAGDTPPHPHPDHGDDRPSLNTPSEHDRHPPAHAHVDPPIPVPDLFAAQPQQDPGQLPGETQNEAHYHRHGILPIAFGLRFGAPPPAFGPPPPPGHPIRATGVATENSPHNHGEEAQPMPFPDFANGGVDHANFRAPGFSANLLLHMPTEAGLDRDQAMALMGLLIGGGRGPGTGQPTGPAHNPDGANHEPEAPREWVPPTAPGPTLRQRVEDKERKAGLRCDGPSCGIGPSDEDPFPEVFNNPNSPSIKRVAILKDDGEDLVCVHVFHPTCLVSADRCAGWGEEDRPSEEDDGEYEVVSCPVCRNVGRVRKEVWEEGARGLAI